MQRSSHKRKIFEIQRNLLHDSLPYFIWLTFLILTACPFLFAVEPDRKLSQYLHQSWGVKEGLPQNTVNTLLQDNKGFIWFGTHEGFVRFDGKRFKTYNSKTFPIMKSNRIAALAEDTEFSIWIGTYGAGIYRLKNDVLNRIPIESFVINQKILGGQLIADNFGKVWAVTQEGLLMLFRDSIFTAFPNSQKPIIGVALVKDRTHGVVFRKGDNIYALDPNTESNSSGVRLVQLSKPAEAGKLLGLVKSYSCNAIALFNNMAIELNTGRILPYNNNILSTAPTYFDSHFHVWHRHPNLYRVDNNLLVDSLPQVAGFSNKLVVTMMEGREGELWIGTENNGLHKLSDTKFISYTRNEGLQGDIIWNVCEDRQGVTWATSLQGYLISLKNSTITNQFVNYDSRRRGFATCYPLKNGDLLTTHYYLYRIRDNKKERLFSEYGDTYHDFQVIFEDQNGIIWIGSERQGLFYIENGKLHNISLGKSHLSNYISSITQDRAGAILVGTQNGIFKLVDKRVVANITENDGLCNNWVRVIYIDEEDGTIWLGTDNGLAHVVNGIITNYTVNDGLFNNVFHTILYRDGRFWYSCNLGIYSIEKKLYTDYSQKKIPSLIYQLYDAEDGLSSVEGNGSSQPAGWKTRDGSLLFAMSNGITFLPGKSHRINLVPQLRITEVNDNGRVISPRDGEIMHLGNGSRNIRISFAVMSFSDPNKNRAKFILEGQDETWNYSEKEFEGRYNNLAPGTYTFKVIGCNNYSNWNLQPASITIIIDSPFYATYWFRGLIITCFIGALFYGIRINERKKVARKLEKLEQDQALDQERARIARDMHDEIGANLTKISLLSGLIPFSNDEKTKNTLDNIGRTLTDTITKMDEIVWAVNPSNDTIRRLISYMVEYAENYFENTSITCRFEIPNHLPDNKITSDRRHHLFLIYKEALNNVLKYSAATVVIIRVEIFYNSWLLSIQDNGIGFDLESVQNNANGLQNMRDRAVLVNSRIKIESTPGRGTGIHVRSIFTSETKREKN